jgi:predicted protein tyrosine phosphatase
MQILATSKVIFDSYMKKKGITLENVESLDKVALISINNPEKDFEPYFKEDRANVKVMTFHDCDGTGGNIPIFNESPRAGTYTVALQPFTREQAKELFAFIKANKEKDTFLIHCTAGVARSGAVATFIQDYIGTDWEKFKRDNSSIQPNAHVYRLLHDEWYKDHAYPSYIHGKSTIVGQLNTHEDGSTSIS